MTHEYNHANLGMPNVALNFNRPGMPFYSGGQIKIHKYPYFHIEPPEF